MNELPNLAGVATANLVEQIGGSGFKASYINWARTLHLLHENAPGWMPELIHHPETHSALHPAPVGAFLLIQFRHVDGTTTTPVPQAVMDHKNNAIPMDKITARDVTDTHVRGVCKAAAVTFGLAYELWAKLPLESGYVEGEDAPQPEPVKVAGKPQDGMTILDFPAERQIVIQEHADAVKGFADDGQIDKAAKAWKEAELDHEEKAALWFLLPSNHRSAITKLLRKAA